MGVNASCQNDISTTHFINSGEKKKRMGGLATFRKRFIRRRRSSRFCDHNRVIREFVSGWSPAEIAALWEEYEASSALKDLTMQADLARPPAPTYKQDLSDLFDYKFCTDVDLVFQGAIFPVHRAILSIRCPYFREILKKIPGYGVQIGVDIRTPGVDIPMFSALLRFLYTGEFHPFEDVNKTHQKRLSNVNLLMQLCEEFGKPNSLESDLKFLLESGEYADCVLTFSSNADQQHQLASSAQSSEDCSGSVSGESSCPSDYGFHNRLEIYCHKAVLSARSPFFRSLIQRKQRNSEETVYERGIPQPTRIVLDEGVIPKRYARVLVKAIYLDSLSLSAIVKDSGSANSLTEAQSMAQTGRMQLSIIEEAMEIYQIGRFLELDILTQSCEDLIVESINSDNLIPVLKWSSQSHGSAWVYRQGIHYLREEFSAIALSNVILELDKSILVNLLSSDFLQGSELEVLQAVIRWGEHHLMKRMEEREPNLVSHTAHSVTKKGLRKKDLNDAELREILSELLPLVRMDHVLPANHETLAQAIKRRLVSTPPSHMIGDDSTNYRVNAWIRSKNNGLFVKPRLFTPYADEIKSLVDEQQTSANQMDFMNFKCYMSTVPDALYMVDNPGPTRPFSPCTVDVVANSIPMPDPDTVSGMVRREGKLVSSAAYQKASSLLFADKRNLRRQVRLRVVREFNLPDAVADVLENAAYSLDEDERPREVPDEVLGQYHQYVLRDGSRSNRESSDFFDRSKPSLGYLGQFRSAEDVHIEGHLSDAVPDVAIASSSLAGLTIGGAGPDNSFVKSPLVTPRYPPYISASMECLESAINWRDPPKIGLDLGDRVHQGRSNATHPVSLFPNSPSGLGSRVIDSGVRSLHRRQTSSSRTSPLSKSLSPSAPQSVPSTSPVARFGDRKQLQMGPLSHTPPLRHYTSNRAGKTANVSDLSPQLLL